MSSISQFIQCRITLSAWLYSSSHTTDARLSQISLVWNQAAEGVKKRNSCFLSTRLFFEVFVFSGRQCLTFHTNKLSPLKHQRRRRIKKETQINTVSILRSRPLAELAAVNRSEEIRPNGRNVTFERGGNCCFIARMFNGRCRFDLENITVPKIRPFCNRCDCQDASLTIFNSTHKEKHQKIFRNMLCPVLPRRPSIFCFLTLSCNTHFNAASISLYMFI